MAIKANKKDLAASMKKKAQISEKDASKALNAAIKTIQDFLKEGSSVTLTGFGTFSIINRKARKGRNPRTGKSIDIPAKNAVKFKAGKNLVEAVNTKKK